ncbi:MAG: hypothetical protein M1828_005635 [Chrysothrix sp. TS-e1954]|nr:MAG: hypothetical protein M1828_005635 [Chrysothrix sp. TS-e1954]
MLWDDRASARESKRHTCWGYTFEESSDHWSKEQIDALKNSYDTSGEACLNILDQVSPPVRGALPRSYSQEQKPSLAGDEKPPPPRDLYDLLRQHHADDPELDQFWTQINTVPEWVDWQQIERGQDVFYRYGGAALTGLAYQSLLGGMGGGRVVETLARTGGFSTKVARRRLFETTQHILQCTKSLQSMQPGGDGFASTIRVRLLHAAVRKRILKLSQEKPEYYSVEKWGIPINDIDSIATILTFSATLIWLSFPRQGIWLRQREIEDYLALWRYVAYVVGCPEGPIETPQKAKALMESLLLHEIKPTDMSKVLANNIIKSLHDQPPGYASADMLIASARWLNGDELCDSLGLARPSLYYKALFAGQCLFFIAVCYTYRSIPPLDRRKVQMLKRVFYAIIVDSNYGLAGTETLFDFKYVPEFSTVTELDSTSQDVPKMRGVEKRNLKSLVIGLGLFGVTSWCTWKVTSLAVGTLWSVAKICYSSISA